MASADKKVAEEKKLSAQEVLDGFKAFQADQQSTATKIAELGGEIREHKLVMDTLAKTDASRRCYRQLGDTLVSLTVKEVLPQIGDTHDKLCEAMANYEKRLASTGEQMNEYRTKHNIRLVSADEKARAEEAARQVAQLGQPQ